MGGLPSPDAEHRRGKRIKSYDVGSLPIDGDTELLSKGAIIFTSILPLLRGPDDPKVRSSRIFEEKIVQVFLDKLRAGIDVPNYPQFRDMSLMFLEMIEGIQRGEKGYTRVKRISLKPEAAIPEVEALRRNASKLRQEAGADRIRIKVCVTGPYTLSSSFERRDASLFAELGDSLAEVLSKAIFRGRDAEVALVAVDEPVLGFLSDPLLDFGSDGREALLRAWERVCHTASSRDVETAFHLHNTSDDLFWSVDSLRIVESHVDDPLYSSEKTKRMLEEKNKFLKASLCITNFDELIMRKLQGKSTASGEGLQEKLAQVWKSIQRGETDPKDFLESSDLMLKRLVQTVERFGKERVPYAGPECGLRSFPTYQCALECLARLSKAVKVFDPST